LNADPLVTVYGQARQDRQGTAEGPGEQGMTAPIQPDRQQGSRQSHPHVAAGRLWAGGVATAVVAGLAALVGVVASRWLFNIPILAPRQDGAYGNATTTALVLAAAAAALLATALIHLLVLSTPRPLAFFSWIIGLATVLLVLFAFRTEAPLTSKAATSVVYLIIGIAIGTLLGGVADRSITTTPADHPVSSDYY
jgi:uncharacterized protein DUF6069